MGQDLSQFTESVPSLLRDTLRKIGTDVAMDLQANSMQGTGNGDEDVIEEEEMAMVSPLYFGIWQDNKGRPFYYDVEHRAYFFLEIQQQRQRPEPPRIVPPETATTTKIELRPSPPIENEAEDILSSSNSSSSPPVAPAMSHLGFITHKIMTDLQIIYTNVTHSVSMLLERGETLEQTRQKLNEMMETASSLERQSRCLACAHRCNTVWPGRGYACILKIADIIPMSACCQDDGMCGPYVYMSEDEDAAAGDDVAEIGEPFETRQPNLSDCHLE